jgi:hypothetical protein
MMPLITIIFLMMSLIFVGGQKFADPEHGGRKPMNRPVEKVNKEIPRIDIKTPSTIKTATFALG